MLEPTADPEAVLTDVAMVSISSTLGSNVGYVRAGERVYMYIWVCACARVRALAHAHEACVHAVLLSVQTCTCDGAFSRCVCRRWSHAARLYLNNPGRAVGRRVGEGVGTGDGWKVGSADGWGVGRAVG